MPRNYPSAVEVLLHSAKNSPSGHSLNQPESNPVLAGHLVELRVELLVEHPGDLEAVDVDVYLVDDREVGRLDAELATLAPVAHEEVDVYKR